MSSNSDLKQAIQSFLSGYSIEATPHDKHLEALAEILPPNTRVYIAHLPGLSIGDVADFAIRLKGIGMTPVPHIVARRMEDLPSLESALAKLQEGGVDHALCIAGDAAADDGPFDSSLELLQTGLMAKYGFAKIGIAGHPEGSKAIGDERTWQFLRDKVAYAKDQPFDLYIATQFCFDHTAFENFDRQTAAEGIGLDIHCGMAGPASLKQLMRYAAVCGVGASAGMLVKRSGAMANLLTKQAPDDLVTAFAKYNLANPDSKLSGGHFFAFGGIVKVAEWANQVVAGQFELNGKATGFKV